MRKHLHEGCCLLAVRACRYACMAIYRRDIKTGRVEREDPNTAEWLNWQWRSSGGQSQIRQQSGMNNELRGRPGQTESCLVRLSQDWRERAGKGGRPPRENSPIKPLL